MRRVLMRSRIFDDQRFGDALLHQQARARAADLPLVEPDSIDQAFHCAVEVGVFEDDEWGFAAEFERETFVACGGCAANGASDFGRSGECNLVDIGMLDQRLAG